MSAKMNFVLNSDFDSQTEESLSANFAEAHASADIKKSVRFEGIPENEMDESPSSFNYHDTIDAAPHIDNYRNVLSVFNDNLRARPSLRDLHEATEGDALIAIPDKDAIPYVDSSRRQSRSPTPGPASKSEPLPDVERTGDDIGKPPTKLGWIQGVLVRCVLNILGVMLYLRSSWVAGQAGIALGALIVLLSALVTTLTAFSMCAICTNGELEGGGAYFLISRSLGPEFGGSIGLMFAFANAVAAAMYVVGFAETVRDIMKEADIQIIDGSTNDIRIVALVVIFLLFIVVVVGLEFESKTQQCLLIILSLSIVNFYIGTVLPLPQHKLMKGVTGYKLSTLMKNLGPDFRNGQTFFSVFAVFFPASTGIMAGANLSGDLKDGQIAIPKGTLMAILITSLIYLSAILITGITCLRDAPVLTGTNFTEWNGDLSSLIESGIESCKSNGTCEYGLQNYFQIMELESGWGPLVTAGIFAATLSSALASLVSAPKIYQAVCKDNLFPYIHWFAKGYGSNDEPRRAYGLTLLIAVTMILIGDLNSIAPIISNFFLASYALINFACFDASFAESPGFRPSFRLYNLWLSLLAAVMCILCMFIIDWATALVTFAFIFTLYVYILRRKPDVNWGSSIQAHSYKSALQSMLKLVHTEDHVKNYRPSILVLSGNPVARPSLVDFVSNITRDFSLLIFGHVIVHPEPELLGVGLREMERDIQHWLQERKVKAFYLPCAATTMQTGVLQLLQLAGLGKLRPNVVFMGFKHVWQTSTLEDIITYVDMIHHAFDSNLGVGIFRAGKGFDFSEQLKAFNHKDTAHLKVPQADTSPILRSDSAETAYNQSLSVLPGNENNNNINLTVEGSIEIDGKSKISTTAKLPLIKKVSNIFSPGKMESTEYINNPSIRVQTEDGDEQPTSFNRRSSRKKDKEPSPPHKRPRHGDVEHLLEQMEVAQGQVQASITQFQKKHAAGGGKKETVDVWWLYDDGGLTLLLPHILVKNKSYVEGAKVRVFALSTSKNQVEAEQRSLAALLHKFRIDHSDVFVLPDICKEPEIETKEYFDTIIEKFRQKNKTVDDPRLISDRNLEIHKNRNNRQMRIHELLRKHSMESSLIILTLPIPRKSLIPSTLYMAWLELLTANQPPTLLIRGNQQSVITFYT